MTLVNLIGLKQFKQTAVDKLHSEIASIGGSELLPTVSLCHQCHYHVPAWRYHKDGKVYMRNENRESRLLFGSNTINCNFEMGRIMVTAEYGDERP